MLPKFKKIKVGTLNTFFIAHEPTTRVCIMRRRGERKEESKRHWKNRSSSRGDRRQTEKKK
jgi:hypothetical protein